MTSNPADLDQDGHDSVNGSPEIGDAFETNEGDESDDYEEIDDEVCSSRGYSTIFEEFQFTFDRRVGKKETKKKKKKKKKKVGVKRYISVPSHFLMSSVTTYYHLQGNTLTHLLIGNVGFIYLLFISTY